MTPAATSALLRLAYVTDEVDARDLLADALHRGATGDELQVALDQWRRLQAQTVQTITTGESR